MTGVYISELKSEIKVQLKDWETGEWEDVPEWYAHEAKNHIDSRVYERYVTEWTLIKSEDD